MTWYTVVRDINWHQPEQPGPFVFAVVENDAGEFSVIGDGPFAEDLRTRKEVPRIVPDDDPTRRAYQWIGGSGMHYQTIERATEHPGEVPELAGRVATAMLAGGRFIQDPETGRLMGSEPEGQPTQPVEKEPARSDLPVGPDALKAVTNNEIIAQADDAKRTLQETMEECLRAMPDGWTQDEHGTLVFGETGVRMTADDIANAVIANARDEFEQPGPITVLVPEDVLGEILDGGRFLNQFETGVSNAVYDPQARATLEHDRMGYDLTIPPSDRPIYGTFSYDPKSIESSSLKQYGDAAVTLKGVEDRATVTLGDSMIDKLVPVPYGGGKEATSTQILAAAAPNFVADSTRQVMDQAMTGGKSNVQPTFGVQADYREAQIGGCCVTVADNVDHVTFRAQPDPAITAKLDAQGIPWTVQA